MGVEDTPGKYQLNELDNKLVNALVEMWRKSSLNHLDCEAIELAMELEKPNEIKDWRKIIILKEAFNKFNSSYENVLNLNMQPTQDCWFLYCASLDNHWAFCCT